jgi:hypothetical protein
VKLRLLAACVEAHLSVQMAAINALVEDLGYLTNVVLDSCEEPGVKAGLEQALKSVGDLRQSLEASSKMLPSLTSVVTPSSELEALDVSAQRLVDTLKLLMARAREQGERPS